MNPRSIMWTYRNIGVLIAFCFVLVLGAFWFTLSQVHLTNAEAGALTNVTMNGAIVNATFTFTNDGLFAVEVERVEYTARLADMTMPLSQGSVDGILVRTDMPTRVPVSLPITWEPTAQLAARLLAGGNTTITISGVATVGAGPFTNDVPFETQIDARSYLQQFVPKTADELLGAVLGLFG